MATADFTQLTEHPCYPLKYSKRPKRSDECGRRSFCDLKLQVPTPIPDIHATVNGFGCIDTVLCSGLEELRESVFRKFCSLPSCTVFEDDSSDRLLCIVAQTTACDLTDRYRLRDGFQVTAMCAATPDELEDNAAAAPETSLLKELNESKQVIPPESMSAILNCGLGYVDDIPSLLYSGELASLGNFDQCIKHHTTESRPRKEAAFQYCTVDYDTIAHRGVCLPEVCHPEDFARMMTFICEEVRSDEYYGYRGSESCLDWVDVIPINTCLVTQLLGCNGTFTNSADITTIFRSGPKSDKKRLLYDWSEQMHVLGPKTFDSLTQTIERAQKIIESRGNRRLSESDAEKSIVDSFKDWLADDSGADTIPNYRFESQQRYKVRIRCGGWFDKLDDSTFCKTAGVLTCALIMLLPFIPPKPRRRTGWFKNLRANLFNQIARGMHLGEGDFAHICGMRAINMFWVVLGHTFTFSWQEGVDRFLQQTIGLIHNYNFQVVISGQLAVDSFFFIAGLMFGLFSASRIESVCTKALQQRNKPLITTCLSYSFRQCLRRYLRLVPTTAVVLAFSYWVLPYLFSGPMWVAYVDYLRYGQKPERDGGCLTHWWEVLLMVSNLDSGGLSCMGHTWYLANDFQFYVASNIVLLVATIWGYSRAEQRIRRTPLYFTLAIIFAICTAWSYRTVRRTHLHFAIPAFSDSNLTPEASQGTRDLAKSWESYYVKPWCRIGPYVIGLVAGVLYRDKVFERFITYPEEPPLIDDTSPILRRSAESPATRRREAPETPRPLNLAGPRQEIRRGGPDVFVIYAYTAAALAVAWICIFTMPYNANRGEKMSWAESLDQLWLVMHRSVWALSCAWISLVLVYVPKFRQHLAPLAPLRSFLSCTPMLICSIFTFTFYLVHPFIQQAYYASRYSDVTVTNLIGWFSTVGHFVLTVVIGILTCIMIEKPFEYLCVAIGF